MSPTITTSTASTSSRPARGSTSTPPEQRKGSAVAATTKTSREASPGSAAVMSGQIRPTDPRTSYSPNREGAVASGAARSAILGLVAAVTCAPVSWIPALPEYALSPETLRRAPTASPQATSVGRDPDAKPDLDGPPQQRRLGPRDRAG